MQNPLTAWRCDRCGEQVTEETGYVVWNHERGERTDIRIIHQAKCDNAEYRASAPLRDFLGPDGLIKCTAMLSLGILNMSRSRGKTSIAPEDLPHPDIWVDFVRRVQTPHYEEARSKLRGAELREYFGGLNEVAPYLQRSLVYVINTRHVQE